MKNRKYIITFLYILLVNHVYSQSFCELKYDYTWIMGGIDLDTVDDKYGGSEIDFNSTPLLFKVHPKPVRMPFHNLSMSSKDGRLIFYSNGCMILNNLDTEMENGDSLSPGEGYELNCPLFGYSGLQNIISIPSSYDSTLYYIVYVSQVFPHDSNASGPVLSENIYYALIDMSLSNGLGGVIKKNEIIVKDTSMIGTPLTATRHANGLDWWIITPDRWSNSFHTSLLDAEGIHYLGKRYIGIPPNSHSDGGQGKFSPDGTKFGWFHPRNGLYLYDFDRGLGLLSNFLHVTIPVSDFVVGGCEFSPSGRFVYVNNDYDLYQIDTESDEIQESVTLIDSYDGFGDPLPTRFFYMERTPDDRIFMNVVNGSQYLHVIQEPDKKEIDCMFEQHALKLPTVNNFTLPHFPNYRLGGITDPLCDSMIVAVNNENKQLLNNYKIFPNPVNDRFSITWEIDLKLEINIFSTEGMLIQSNLVTSSIPRYKEIYCDSWVPGIYFVQFVTAEGLFTEKVIKR